MRDFSPLEGRMRGVKGIIDVIPLNPPLKGEIKKNNILVNDKNKQLTRLNRGKRNFERT